MALLRAGGCGLILLLLVVAPRSAAGSLREDIATDVARSPVHQGLLRQGKQTADDYGDLDGDGRPEAVVSYRIETAGGEVWGVLVIYGSFEAVYRERAAYAWRGIWPVTVGVTTGLLRLEMASGTGEKARPGKVEFAWGDDLDFQREPAGKVPGITAWASSTLKARRARTKPEALIDGTVTSGWAEGAHGTGISEKVRLSFAKATDVALLGIAGGNGASAKAFALSNRVGRAELRILTSAEEGDPAAGIDYAAMGLAFSGQKDRFDLPDQAGLTFVPVDTRQVRHLELKVLSVYLGDRLDDLWIAELLPVVLLSAPAKLVRVPDPDLHPAHVPVVPGHRGPTIREDGHREVGGHGPAGAERP